MDKSEITDEEIEDVLFMSDEEFEEYLDARENVTMNSEEIFMPKDFHNNWILDCHYVRANCKDKAEDYTEEEAENMAIARLRGCFGREYRGQYDFLGLLINIGIAIFAWKFGLTLLCIMGILLVCLWEVSMLGIIILISVVLVVAFAIGKSEPNNSDVLDKEYNAHIAVERKWKKELDKANALLASHDDEVSELQAENRALQKQLDKQETALQTKIRTINKLMSKLNKLESTNTSNTRISDDDIDPFGGLY